MKLAVEPGQIALVRRMEEMQNRSIKIFAAIVLALTCATYAMGNRSTPPTSIGNSFAKLIVTISGPRDDWASYGWLWDDGERRNGAPWVVSSGTLGGESTARSGKGSNKSIYWWITETAWTMRSGPTEIEILNAIGIRGWRLVETQATALHPYVPTEMKWDSATTYLFQR